MLTQHLRSAYCIHTRPCQNSLPPVLLSLTLLVPVCSLVTRVGSSVSVTPRECWCGHLSYGGGDGEEEVALAPPLALLTCSSGSSSRRKIWRFLAMVVVR